MNIHRFFDWEKGIVVLNGVGIHAEIRRQKVFGNPIDVIFNGDSSGVGNVQTLSKHSSRHGNE
jgi:hypothetical protein